MPVVEILTVVSAIAAVISGAAAARELFLELWKKIRGKQQQSDRFLQRLKDMSSDVHQRCKTGIEMLGQPFSEGDHEARSKMMQILDEMNRKLIAAIETAQAKALKASIFCAHLEEVVSGLRQETFDCLNLLSRRIRSSMPAQAVIPRSFMDSPARRILNGVYLNSPDRIASMYWAPEPADLEPDPIQRISSAPARTNLQQHPGIRSSMPVPASIPRPFMHPPATANRIYIDSPDCVASMNWAPEPAELEAEPVRRTSSMLARTNLQYPEIQLTPISALPHATSGLEQRTSNSSSSNFLGPEINLTPLPASPRPASELWRDLFGPTSNPISVNYRASPFNAQHSGNESDNVLARNLRELGS